MLIDLETVYGSKKRAIHKAVWVAGEKRLSYSLPLTIAGVGVEGLWLEISTPIFAVNRDVHIILVAEAEGAKRGSAIERIDWRPSHDHNNRDRGPKNLRHVMQVTGHIHAFSLNWIEAEKRMLEGNLPIAYPEDIDGFSTEMLFQFAFERFRIEPLRDTIPPPEWQSDLFA